MQTVKLLNSHVTLSVSYVVAFFENYIQISNHDAIHILKNNNINYLFSQ